MAARPRNKKFKGLPPNLYENIKAGVSYFRYKRPDNGTWHAMGSDRVKAVDAAQQLNSKLMQGYDFVANVMGENSNSTETLQGFISYFRERELLRRKPAAASLKLFVIRVKQINSDFGSKLIDEITIRDVASFLDTLTPRGSNQARGYLVDIFNHAVAKGLCSDNPAACTIKQIEEKQRKRHTIKGLKAIHQVSPEWLKNAIDLALITAQRRGDILNMRFEDVKDSFLYVVQHKTEKSSDAGWLRFELTPQLKSVINRCRDNIPSPYLIHRKPDSRRASKGRDHWTQINADYLTRAFKKAVDLSGAYKEMSDAEKPTFHEIRALSIKLYKQQGKDAQKIAGHASEQMTKNYAKGHDETVWSDVIPDLDISEIVK